MFRYLNTQQNVFVLCIFSIPVCLFQGACILNMLRDFLTPEVFQIGIIRYLKRYSYQNTETKDLWESLTNVSDLSRISLPDG